MTILTLKNIMKSFGATQVLTGVSFSVTDSSVLGLVGSNGAGKTTLLRIITGEISADEGTINIPGGQCISYLEQETSEKSVLTVWALMLTVFDSVFALEDKMRTLEHEMHDASEDQTAWDKISLDYEQTTQNFEEAGGYSYKSAIKGVLSGLGLYQDVYEQRVNTLSGGQRSRLYLAKMLLEKPDLLLLDEPTNHLDTTAIAWLESYLKTWQGAIVIVSHDRWFLDQLCNQIVQIEDGRSDVYKGNYTAYISARAEKRAQMVKSYEQNQLERTRTKQIIERYKVWGRMGGGKNFIKAKAKQTMLDKMDKLEKVSTSGKNMSLRFNSASRGGNDVLQIEDLAMSFDDLHLFSKLTIHLQKGDKAALVGANGIGKTTLLRIIASRLSPTHGTVQLGSNIEVSYYDQLQQNLDPALTMMAQMQSAFPSMGDSDVRNRLAAFLFFGDDVFKKISTLSGGEKGRLSLLLLMLGQANLLLLDEPTNHLDMDSREILEDALMSFDGTVLFVSHDRYFINKLSNRVLEMKADEVTQHPGNWTDYLAFLEKQKLAALNQDDPSLTKTALAKQKREARQQEAKHREAKKRVKLMEHEIAALENQLSEIEQTLSNPADLDDAQVVSLSADHEGIQNQIDALMHEWEVAHEYIQHI